MCILQIESQDRIGFAFLESSRFNIEFWRGNTLSADYIMPVRMIKRHLALDTVNPPNAFSTQSGSVSLQLTLGSASIRGVHVNGVPAIPDHGIYSVTAPLTLGGNFMHVFSRNETDGIMNDYLVYYLGQPHSFPLSVDPDMLISPAPGESILCEPVSLAWNPAGIIDHIGLSNVLISTIYLVPSNGLETVATVMNNVPNPWGSCQWTPPIELANPSNAYYLSFDILGSYGMSTNIVFRSNPFFIVPEPVTVPFILLCAVILGIRPIFLSPKHSGTLN